MDATHDFIKHNAEFLDDLRSREDRTRKLDVIDDEAVFAFYDRRVDPEWCRVATSTAGGRMLAAAIPSC